MKVLVLALVLIKLTAPNGVPIWLTMTGDVAVFAAPEGTCGEPAKTVIVTGVGRFCVQESVEHVVHKLGK